MHTFFSVLILDADIGMSVMIVGNRNFKVPNIQPTKFVFKAPLLLFPDYNIQFYFNKQSLFPESTLCIKKKWLLKR